MKKQNNINYKVGLVILNSKTLDHKKYNLLLYTSLQSNNLIFHNLYTYGIQKQMLNPEELTKWTSSETLAHERHLTAG